MKILSQKEGFDCDHSAVNYEFISEGKIPEETKAFARQSSHRFKISQNKLEIQIPGEGYLYNSIQDALLSEHNFPLLIYEDYDWWNFLLMFDYNKGLMKSLKKYETGENDYTINVSKKNQKIELWITVHLDYGYIGDAGYRSPFKLLGKMFLEIRKDILKGNSESLEILKKYCEEENISKLAVSSDQYKELILILSKEGV